MVDLSFRWLRGLSVCRCELYWTAIHAHLYIHSITNLYSFCNIDADVGPYLYLYTYSDIYTNIHSNKYFDADTYTNLYSDQYFDADLYAYIYSNQYTLSDSNAVAASDRWTGGLRPLGRCRLVQRDRVFGINCQ